MDPESLNWKACGRITLDQDRWPRFGPVPSVPGLYRITLDDGFVYIGQTTNLDRRVREYRRPTDGTIGEEVIHLAVQRAGGGRLEICADALLTNAARRRHCERTAIAEAAKLGLRLLNRTGGPNPDRIALEIAYHERRLACLRTALVQLEPA